MEEGARVGHVHVKVLLPHAPKLQVNVIVVVLVDQLKVLHARLVDASVEIQHKGLDLCSQNQTSQKSESAATYIRSTWAAY